MVQVLRQKPKTSSDRWLFEEGRKVGQGVRTAKSLELWGKQKVLLNDRKGILKQAPDFARGHGTVLGNGCELNTQDHLVERRIREVRQVVRSLHQIAYVESTCWSKDCGARRVAGASARRNSLHRIPGPFSVALYWNFRPCENPASAGDSTQIPPMSARLTAILQEQLEYGGAS
jgi:hypothetical protein